MSHGQQSSIVNFISWSFLVDVISHPIYIPPPDFRISIFPNPSEIKQGEERTLELRVNSTTLAQPILDITQVNASNGVGITFIPNTMYIPSEGEAISHIKVNATGNATTGPHTFGIYTKISFPATFNATQFASQVLSGKKISLPATFSKLVGEQIQSNSTVKVSKLRSLIIVPRPSYFSVIVDKYSFADRFRDFWNIYGGVIGLLGGGLLRDFRHC